MKLVVGLGNPGKKYENTRHNIGFVLLNNFASKEDLDWQYTKKFDSDIAEYKDFSGLFSKYFGDTDLKSFKNEKILLIKPQTFMNKSGESVSKLISFYNLSPEDILVIHDDVDIPIDSIKLQKGRGAAGHKGVKNIIDHLKSKDFNRMRVGVGKPQDPNIAVEDWVLMKFPDSFKCPSLSY